MDSRPIGLFDSGFGGLTVARAVMDLLPAEDLVYLGDTARYPYGSRSGAEVRQFSLEIAAHLVDRYNIKMLVAACNTATSAALQALRETLSIPVMGVIEPGVVSLRQASQTGRIGVIGTFGTIASGAYQTAVASLAPDADLVTCACPGLVEFVERGVTSGPEVELLCERLLAPLIDESIDALLLGCTHYPYLARVISDTLGRGVVLVSSADETAFALAAKLTDLDLLNGDPSRSSQHRFVTSGDVRAFTRLGSQLLGPELLGAEQWTPDLGDGGQP